MASHRTISGTIKIKEKKGKKRVLFTPEENGQTVGLTDINESYYNKIGSDEKKCRIIKENSGGAILSIQVEIEGEYQTLYEKINTPKKTLSVVSTLKSDAQKNSNRDSGFSNEQGSQTQQAQSKVMHDSFNVAKTRLPNDTKEALKRFRNVDNFSLKLNKAARVEVINDNKKFVFFGKQFEPQPKYGTFDFTELCNRHDENIQKWCIGQGIFKSLELKVNKRLVVGLGIESVYETSIALHHIYGIPYIPASAIKGVVRSWIITEVFGEHGIPDEETDFPLVNAEHRAYLDEGFCKLFGCPKTTKAVEFENRKPKENQNGNYEYISAVNTALKKEHQGLIWFFDAFPLTAPEFEVDMINVHYKDYYNNEGREAPHDHDSPSITNFLTVKPDVKFKFHIGIKNDEPVHSGSKILDYQNEEGNKVINTDEPTYLELAEAWLKKALTEHGIGAKTALDYGHMSER